MITMERTMKRRMAATAAALALVAGGGVLAGCGSDSGGGAAASTAAVDTAALGPANDVETLSAQEIFDKAQAAASAASSVTVTGEIAQGSNKVAWDLQVGDNAANGTIEVLNTEVGIRVVDGKTYLKTSGEGVAKIAGQGDNSAVVELATALIGDKWLLAPANSGIDEFEFFSQFADRDSLLKEILPPEGTVSVKGTGEVNGIPVVFLESTGDGPGTLAVQTVGEPYPVQVAGSGSDFNGEVNFTNWNDPVDVTAPTDDDVVELNGALANALTNLGGSS